MAFTGDDIRIGRKAGTGGNLEHGQLALNTTLQVLYAGMSGVASSPTPIRAVAYPSGSAPSSPPNGYCWWDSTNVQFNVYDGSAFKPLVTHAQALARGLGA